MQNGNGADPIDEAIALSAENERAEMLHIEDWKHNALSVVVVGASGDCPCMKYCC